MTDCTDTDHVCIPDPVEGSQGPSHPDTACVHAFDEDDQSAWAVNPDRISDPTGAGSFVDIVLDSSTTIAAVRYKQVR